MGIYDLKVKTRKGEDFDLSEIEKDLLELL